MNASPFGVTGQNLPAAVTGRDAQQAPPAAGWASPFSVAKPMASGAPGIPHFTASELQALVPAHRIRPGGVPPQQEVPLSLEILKAALDSGRPAVALRHLHEACPQLFFPPASPFEDTPVNLPPQKVKRIVEAMENAAAVRSRDPHPAAAAPAAERREKPASPFAPDARMPIQSPFQPAPGSPSIQPVGSKLPPPRRVTGPHDGASSPFAVASAATSPFTLEKPGPNAPSGPFRVAPKSLPLPKTSPPPKAAGFGAVPPTPSSPFSVVSALDVPPAVESPFAVRTGGAADDGGVHAHEPEAPVTPMSIDLSLGTLLKNVPAAALGFDPARVPETVRIELPFEPIRRMLSSGRVVLPLGTVVDHLDPLFHAAFERADRAAEVVVPLQEIFHNLPAGALPARQPAPEAEEASFETPFSIAAREDRRRAMPGAPVPTPFAPAPATAAFSYGEPTAPPASRTPTVAVSPDPHAPPPLAEGGDELAPEVATAPHAFALPHQGGHVTGPAEVVAAAASSHEPVTSPFVAISPAPHVPPPVPPVETPFRAAAVEPATPAFSAHLAHGAPPPPSQPMFPSQPAPAAQAAEVAAHGFPMPVFGAAAPAPAAPAAPAAPTVWHAHPPAAPGFPEPAAVAPPMPAAFPAAKPAPLPEVTPWGPPPAAVVPPAEPPPRMPEARTAPAPVQAAPEPASPWAAFMPAPPPPPTADLPLFADLAPPAPPAPAVAALPVAEPPPVVSAPPPVPAPVETVSPPVWHPLASAAAAPEMPAAVAAPRVPPTPPTNPFASAPGTFGAFTPPAFDDEPPPLESLQSAPAPAAVEPAAPPEALPPSVPPVAMAPAAAPVLPETAAPWPGMADMPSFGTFAPAPDLPAPAPDPAAFPSPQRTEPVALPAMPPPPVAAVHPPVFEAAPELPVFAPAPEVAFVPPAPPAPPVLPPAVVEPPVTVAPPPMSVYAAPEPVAAPVQPVAPQSVGTPTALSFGKGEDLSFGYVSDDPTQLALRAIFATDQTLRPQDVVNLASQFSGIQACLIITPEGVTRSEWAADGEDVRSFSERAPALHEKTLGLARELGLAGEQTFTLRTNRGVVSFFVNGSLCLAALHAQPNFQPGVRERLVMVTRELAKMLGAA